MSRRETALQIAAVAIGLALSMLWVRFGSPGSFTTALFVGAFYVIVLAGTHVVLALRGEGGSVPVAARWRFVAVVVAAAAAMSVGIAAGPAGVAGVSLGELVGPTAAALLVGYWLYEAREGYRASRQSPSDT